jgi:catechol 2,3-dioxygenase-like lactoylglutathione lyase family enzyme
MTNVTIWVDDPTVLRDWYREVIGCTVVEETPRFVMLRGGEGAATRFTSENHSPHRTAYNSTSK